MRQLFVLGMVVVAAGLVRAAVDGPVNCKADGVHLCCGQCDKAVKEILGNVKGVSAVKVDRKAADKVTFTAETEAVANDALTALVKGGFACELTAGTKKFSAPKTMVNVKGDVITVTGSHVCCGTCIKAVKALFKDNEVIVNGTGTLRDIVIKGKNLDGQVVLDTLEKGGFSGTIQSKK
jgi:periplasmic mercuric ion binding protein